MCHGSLFSGIGGFDIAAEWVGWTNIFQVEIDPFCLQVLKHHFPFAHQFTDITKFKGHTYYGTIDVVSGGFPCQPFSVAGQRRGSEDHRYLWPEMLRVIDEIRPAWIVGENVAGITSMVQPGLPVNLASETYLSKENTEDFIQQQFIIHTICEDLDRIGYTVQPFIIPACGTGAPHRRDRIWLIGHRCERKNFNASKAFSDEIITYPNGTGLERPSSTIIPRGNRQPTRPDQVPNWTAWPTQPPVCNRDNGISTSLANISFPKWRRQAIHALGNAIVPQVAYQIFSAIQSLSPSEVSI